MIRIVARIRIVFKKSKKIENVNQFDVILLNKELAVTLDSISTLCEKILLLRTV